MRDIALVTDVPFWEAGNGQRARIRALHDFLSIHSRLTLYYLGSDPLPLPGIATSPQSLLGQLIAAQHERLIVENLGLKWICEFPLENTSLYLDAHDLLSDRATCFAAFGKESIPLSFEEELSFFGQFDKVILLQKEEHEKVSRFVSPDSLLLCPHPVVPEQEIHTHPTVRNIGFLGGPSWPNIDGMQWFHDEVMPLLQESASLCTLNGAILTSPLAIFLPHIRKGDIVDSLAQYYASIDIAINPVPYGSGLKIKTVEAIAYGIPLVTTSAGAQGLQEGANHAFLVADTAQDFAQALHNLVSSRALREELSCHAKAFAKKHFTPEACFFSLIAP